MRALWACTQGSVAMAVLVLVSAGARAATYTVDVANSRAADTNSGSEAEPWSSIQHAADTVAPGDEVQVKPGSYDERVVVKKGGTADAKKTFRSVPSRSAKMFGFNVIGAPHVRIEGFDITNSPDFDGWDETQGVFVQSDYVEVVDNYFHDMADAGVVGYWHEPFPNYATIAKNRMYRMQMGITNQGTGWTIEDNEVERLYMFSGGGDCDYCRLFGDGHVVRHNFFHGTNFDEIGDAHVDCFQTFDNNGEHLRDVLIDGNTCFDFHQAFMGEASFYGASSHIVFTNNLFAHGGAWGLCVHQITDVEAYNNTFYDIAYHGAGFRDGASGIVRNNIFMNVESSYWASDGGSVTGDFNIIMNSSAPDTPGANDLVDIDPMFVNPANNDFHLLTGSPAIDKGEARQDVPTDHDGISRPQGAGWDIGAYEFCAGTCPTAPGSGWGGFPGSTGTGGTSGHGSGCSCSLAAPGQARIDECLMLSILALASALPRLRSRPGDQRGDDRRL
jgi:hypothetical protein